MDRQTNIYKSGQGTCACVYPWMEVPKRKTPKGSKPSTLGSSIPWYSPFLAKEHLAHTHTTTPTTKQDAIGAFEPFPESPSEREEITGQGSHPP